MSGLNGDRGTVNVEARLNQAWWDVESAHRKAKAAADLALDIDENHGGQPSSADVRVLDELIDDVYTAVCEYHGKEESNPLALVRSKNAFYLAAAVHAIARHAVEGAHVDHCDEIMGLAYLMPMLEKELAASVASWKPAKPQEVRRRAKAKPSTPARKVAA